MSTMDRRLSTESANPRRHPHSRSRLASRQGGHGSRERTRALLLRERTETIRRESVLRRQSEMMLNPPLPRGNTLAPLMGRPSRSRGTSRGASRTGGPRSSLVSRPSAVDFGRPLAGDRPRTGDRPHTGGSHTSSIFEDEWRPASRGGVAAPTALRAPASSAAVARSVWLGGIPDAIQQSKREITDALTLQFGPVESLQIREKRGDASWGFAVFKDPKAAFHAAMTGTAGVAVGSAGYSLTVEPLALHSQMRTEQRKGNEDGALATMWSKTIHGTRHGKNLNVLRDKLEAAGGNAHSAFRTLKGFDRKSVRDGDSSDKINGEEFHAACTKLNLGMSKQETQDLFDDLGGQFTDGITLTDLYGASYSQSICA